MLPKCSEIERCVRELIIEDGREVTEQETQERTNAWLKRLQEKEAKEQPAPRKIIDAKKHLFRRL